MASPPAIETAGLCRRFKDVLAVDDLTLTVRGPGVFGFLGANGAGKTTTMRMLAGLIHPSSGEARLLGEPVSAHGEAVRRRMGYLPQDPAFPGWMTAEEYLRHVGDLFGLPREKSRRRSAELLERCGLTEAARRRIAGFSGGMKQRLGIAQALINEPELLLLDEPVSALDPVGRVEVLDLIKALGERATVFMSSHILADVERVSAEVAIMDRGRLLVHERTDVLKARAVRPMLTLRIRGPSAGLRAALEGAPWLEACVEDPGAIDTPDLTTFRLTVRDTEAAERRIPALVAEAKVGLVSLAQATPTLEEIFITLVGGGRRGPEETSA